jgi:hypothetical protein
VSGFRREFFFRFARDAGTGSTHAAPGGDPPNPLLVVLGLGGVLSGEIDMLDDAVTIGVETGVLALDDVYAGYASATEGSFKLAVEAHPADDLAFPDYVPGVFPTDQQYDIDRDWQHARALVGVEVKLR